MNKKIPSGLLVLSAAIVVGIFGSQFGGLSGQAAGGESAGCGGDAYYDEDRGLLVDSAGSEVDPTGEATQDFSAEGLADAELPTMYVGADAWGQQFVADAWRADRAEEFGEGLDSCSELVDDVIAQESVESLQEPLRTLLSCIFRIETAEGKVSAFHAWIAIAHDDREVARVYPEGLPDHILVQVRLMSLFGDEIEEAMSSGGEHPGMLSMDDTNQKWYPHNPNARFRSDSNYRCMTLFIDWGRSIRPSPARPQFGNYGELLSAYRNSGGCGSSDVDRFIIQPWLELVESRCGFYGRSLPVHQSWFVAWEFLQRGIAPQEARIHRDRVLWAYGEHIQALHEIYSAYFKYARFSRHHPVLSCQ